MKKEKLKSKPFPSPSLDPASRRAGRAGRYEFVKEVNRVKGFTLIELLVSISIIATLTAILLPNFMGARERAKDSQKISDLNSVKNALRMYYNEHQVYPIDIDGTTDLSSFLSTFLPGISQVGYTYYSDATGETFDLCTGLDSGSGDEDIKSQVNCGANTTGVCGLAVGTRDKLFVVCAK